MTTISALRQLGQSLWLDNITRALLDSGTLARYKSELGVTGLTSNPTIYDRAIGGSGDYDAQIAAAAGDSSLEGVAIGIGGHEREGSGSGRNL
ncbi:MAG TPA: transaldolase family protein [Candidatus Limnocylindrales bacterium]